MAPPSTRPPSSGAGVAGRQPPSLAAVRRFVEDFFSALALSSPGLGELIVPQATLRSGSPGAAQVHRLTRELVHSALKSEAGVTYDPNSLRLVSVDDAWGVSLMLLPRGAESHVGLVGDRAVLAQASGGEVVGLPGLLIFSPAPVLRLAGMTIGGDL